jgi:septum formation protein
VVPRPRLILASTSPRRREILGGLGIPFEVVVPEVEEVREGDPEEVVLENARRKARAGRERADDDRIVLGVDTDVALDGRLLGKATSRNEARRRLEALSGRTHTVLSSVVLLGPGLDEERSGIARSEVTFRVLDEATRETYLRSGEWRDRAGAYAIQGLGSVLIEKVEGDFSNVVGLPVRLLLELAPELFDAAGESLASSPKAGNPQVQVERRFAGSSRD